MQPLKHTITSFFLVLTYFVLPAQSDSRSITVKISSADSSLITTSSIELLAADRTRIATKVPARDGIVQFRNLAAGIYWCRATHVTAQPVSSAAIDLRTKQEAFVELQLNAAVSQLNAVTVVGRKPFVQLLPDKTVVNVDAGVTNAGATVMEVLEKSPGISLDRDGNINMKGKAGVLVMIDGKPSLLSGAELSNLLNSMNAAQVETIELIDNPSARYDAAGNAGIINIKTKRNRQRGWNGNLTLTGTMGRYPKSNQSLQLNYRSGKVNYYLNYSAAISQYFMQMVARRSNYDSGKANLLSVLEQPFFTKGNILSPALRVGADFFLNSTTTLGIAANGNYLNRKNVYDNTASWINESGGTDSLINTSSSNTNRWRSGGLSLSLQHHKGKQMEYSADLDYLRYHIRGEQYFENQLQGSGNPKEANQGYLPADLTIFSGKFDFTRHFKTLNWEAGFKTSHIHTDNLAEYFYKAGGTWSPDYGRTNHFLYTENIHAAYSSLAAKKNRWEWQAGLRYEYTAYRANQMGNVLVNDSAFTRNYSNLFPTALLSYQADSSNGFTLRAGRRIDRPAFQKLNPFSSIINKYTYQEGNPYILPQYTWNVELSHQYRDQFSTSISYNVTSDYFSQIFYGDTATQTIIYTEGNIGKMQNLGLNLSGQFSPLSWWSFTVQGNLNHKRLRGFVWNNYQANITQFSLSTNHQFRFRKGWSAELSGFYIGKNQNDLQEVLDPTGQVSAGVGKQLWGGKGTIRLTCRDIFYTQAMQGWTEFERATEFFRFQRDSRLATLSFTYRFGRAARQAARRNSGAEAEIERVGTGG